MPYFSECGRIQHFLLRHLDVRSHRRKQHLRRVWLGLLRVVHLAALFLFSAKRKRDFFQTRTTEEPLDSGNACMFATSIKIVFSARQCLLHQRKSSLAGRGLRWGFLIWLAARQVLYGGAWIYFSYVLVSKANQTRIKHFWGFAWKSRFQ